MADVPCAFQSWETRLVTLVTFAQSARSGSGREVVANTKNGKNITSQVRFHRTFFDHHRQLKSSMFKVVHEIRLPEGLPSAKI